jgi:Phage integrase, N-terminal SAM-like domain
MASIAKRPDGQWRARYRGPDGSEHSKHFGRRVDAQRWLDQETTKQQTGSWIAPRAAKITVEEWCTRWLAGYRTRKPSTVRMAQVHIAKIVEQFGRRRLDSLRPSDIKSWLVQLQAEHASSYVYALHARLAQVRADAVHDGVLARNPCSRRTRRVPALSGLTWPPRSRSGRSTMRWGSGTERACCWHPLLA